MTETTYLEELAKARSAFEEWEPYFEEAQKREREIYQRYSEHWALMVGYAIRALGQGADLKMVYSQLMGHPLITLKQIYDFERTISGHLANWIRREANVSS